MTTRYFLVHHKTFDKTDFFLNSANFTEPAGITLVTAFDGGLYSNFSIYTVDSPANEAGLKTFLDTQYINACYNVLYEINPATSAGWGSFQSIAALKAIADANANP